MSHFNNIDSDEMAFQAGYDKGYLEARFEHSQRIREILRDYLHTGKYTATEMALAISEVLDGK